MAGAVQTRPFSVDWVTVTMLGLGVVHVAAAGDSAVELVGSDQAVVAAQPGELGAREPDGPTRFVEKDVGDVAAEDLVPRLDRRRQRDDVGCRAGEREQHLGLGGVEGCLQGVGGVAGHGVSAIRRGRPVVDLLQGFERLGVRRRGVVGGESSAGRRHVRHDRTLRSVRRQVWVGVPIAAGQPPSAASSASVHQDAEMLCWHMRTTIDLPEDLHKQAQAIARDTRRTLSETVVDLMRRGLGASNSDTAMSTDPRTGLPLVSVGTIVTSEDVRSLEDEE